MRRKTVYGAAVLLGGTLLLNLYYVYKCGDGLSPIAHAYSQGGSLRGGERFAVEGLTINYGLADLSYGGRYPGVGLTGPSGKDPNDPVYHGYPPGPEWLNALQIRVWGPEHPSRLRILPVAVGMIAAGLFLASLATTIGGPRALTVYLVCVLSPMFTNMTHGLHYQGYAFSLLLLELALLMPTMRKLDQPLGVRLPVLLFLLGFFQGWLSFDYCFVVTFAAVPMAFLLVPEG